jgi:hypothetical protein
MVALGQGALRALRAEEATLRYADAVSPATSVADLFVPHSGWVARSDDPIGDRGPAPGPGRVLTAS